MSYWCNTGKFQKAYDFLYKNLKVQKDNRNPYSKMLGKLGWVYYRYYNDGDTYETLTYCYETEEEFKIFANNKNFPQEERNEIENILNKHDTYENCLENAVNYLLTRIMLYLSTEEKIYNPDTNRLINFYSPKGIECLKKLGCTLSHSGQKLCNSNKPLKTKINDLIN